MRSRNSIASLSSEPLITFTNVADGVNGYNRSSNEILLNNSQSDPQRCMSVTNPPSPYMSRQKHIDIEMRSVLIDWVLEVHTKHKLHPSSYWLAVNILDRYLDKGDGQVCWSEFEHLGITSLMIAVKFKGVRTLAKFYSSISCHLREMASSIL